MNFGDEEHIPGTRKFKGSIANCKKQSLYFELYGGIVLSFSISKKNATYPWNIPQTLKHLFMKEILSYLYFGVPGVCSKGLVGIFLDYMKVYNEQWAGINKRAPCMNNYKDPYQPAGISWKVSGVFCCSMLI